MNRYLIDDSEDLAYDSKVVFEHRCRNFCDLVPEFTLGLLMNRAPCPAILPLAIYNVNFLGGQTVGGAGWMSPILRARGPAGVSAQIVVEFEDNCRPAKRGTWRRIHSITVVLTIRAAMFKGISVFSCLDISGLQFLGSAYLPKTQTPIALRVRHAGLDGGGPDGHHHLPLISPRPG